MATKTQKTTWRADWEAVEADYRSSVLSIREIGKKHGVSDTIIRRKANAGGWMRPLSNRVREEIDEQLLRDAAEAHDADSSHPGGSHPHRAPARTRDGSIIERAAAMGVELVRSHRADLAAMHDERRRLLNKLAKIAEIRKMTAEQREAAGISDEDFESIEKMGLADEVAILEGLARVAYRLIPLERQAYSLDAKDANNAANGGAGQNIFVVPTKVAEPVQTRPMTEEEIAAADADR